MVGGMDRVDERSSVVDRGNDSMVSHGSHGGNSVVGDRVGSLVDRLRVCLALIPHVGDEAVLVVGVVRDDLDTTVRKLHSVLALDHSVLILSLSLGEVSSILVSTSVFVGKWLWWQFFLVVGSRVVGCRSRRMVRSRSRSVARSNGNHRGQGRAEQEGGGDQDLHCCAL